MDKSSLKDLITNAGKIDLPCNLFLKKSEKILECSKVLRYIPKRRIVFSGHWDDQKIVAKIFFKPLRAKIHLEKEIKGNSLLKKAGIPTCKILHSEFCEDIEAYVLIFEFIEKEQDSALLLSEQYLTSLVKLIAIMHNNGLIHHDLHPGNFILKNETIYALDGAAIEKKGRTFLSKDDGLKNLSVMLAQIGFQNKDTRLDLGRSYLRVREFNHEKDDMGKLEEYVKVNKQQIQSRYIKKIYRNSSRTLRKKSFFSLVLCQREYYTDRMESFLKNPDIAFSESNKVFLKKGNTATVVKYEIDGRQLVVKRYNIKNFFHGFRRALKKSRADISWKSAHLLAKNEIKTSNPVAIKEKRFGPFRNKAFFICEFLEGENARQFFPKAKEKDQKKVAQSIISMFNTLNLFKITHGDMKATNIIIKDREPHLIDLDSMAIHISKFSFNRAFKKDINRFMKNWKELPKIAKLFKSLTV